MITQEQILHWIHRSFADTAGAQMRGFGLRAMEAETQQLAGEIFRFIAPLQNQVEAMNALRQLCGYIENASQQLVKISQDDATKTWSCWQDGVNSNTGYGDSLEAAIRDCVKKLPAES